ncbi:hypothetical protein D3C83_198800 [compost metagenome]
MARFIGSSNVIKGAALDADHISFCDVPLRCVGDKLTPGSAAAVSVRQHVIRLCAEQPQATENVVPATVVR